MRVLKVWGGGQSNVFQKKFFKNDEMIINQIFPKNFKYTE